MYVTDVMDRACACLKSVLRLGVDKHGKDGSLVCDNMDV